MKNSLVFLVALGLVIAFGIVGFARANTIVDVGGNVTSNFTLVSTPSSLDFGSMTPDTTKDVSATLMDDGTSDLSIQMISVSNVTGSVFIDSNVMLSINGGAFNPASLLTAPMNITAGATQPEVVRLHVPISTHSGSFTGTITYTVMEG